jgi:hypothetical protein
VEPVADEVAILDQGRIVRQSETEVLRRDVKQIVLGREAAAAVGETASVLQRRDEGRELALVVDGAQEVIDRLRREGVEHRVVDLNLDEIFEAFVTGSNETEPPQIAEMQHIAGEA